eukprot:TRINITY_DN61217_c0_g1_i1.p1 TRINITY_DN61217_c0_g1~~TRINITY_DN61217_c0_g1_i1.p1  ORF type:complete len:537 (+),score=70.21 TRINITY_DN61217_c0_g1_i1:61-1671(+)
MQVPVVDFTRSARPEPARDVEEPYILAKLPVELYHLLRAKHTTRVHRPASTAKTDVNFESEEGDADHQKQKKVKLQHKGSWTPCEDKKLFELVQEIGAGNWTKLAASFCDRTGKQCRERYLNHLDPALKKERWTEEEDNVILAQQRVRGNQWANIAKLLPGRSANAIKNRWNAHLSKVRHCMAANNTKTPAVTSSSDKQPTDTNETPPRSGGDLRTENTSTQNQKDLTQALLSASTLAAKKTAENDPQQHTPQPTPTRSPTPVLLTTATPKRSNKRRRSEASPAHKQLQNLEVQNCEVPPPQQQEGSAPHQPPQRRRATRKRLLATTSPNNTEVRHSKTLVGETKAGDNEKQHQEQQQPTANDNTKLDPNEPIPPSHSHATTPPPTDPQPSSPIPTVQNNKLITLTRKAVQATNCVTNNASSSMTTNSCIGGSLTPLHTSTCVFPTSPTPTSAKQTHQHQPTSIANNSPCYTPTNSCLSLDHGFVVPMSRTVTYLSKKAGTAQQHYPSHPPPPPTNSALCSFSPAGLPANNVTNPN